MPEEEKQSWWDASLEWLKSIPGHVSDLFSNITSTITGFDYVAPLEFYLFATLVAVIVAYTVIRLLMAAVGRFRSRDDSPQFYEEHPTMVQDRIDTAMFLGALIVVPSIVLLKLFFDFVISGDTGLSPGLARSIFYLASIYIFIGMLGFQVWRAVSASLTLRINDQQVELSHRLGIGSRRGHLFLLRFLRILLIPFCLNFLKWVPIDLSDWRQQLWAADGDKNKGNLTQTLTRNGIEGTEPSQTELKELLNRGDIKIFGKSGGQGREIELKSMPKFKRLIASLKLIANPSKADT